MAFYSMPALLAPRAPGADASPEEVSAWQDRLVAYLGQLSLAMEELGDAYVGVTDQLNDAIVSRPKLTADLQADLSDASTVFDETVNYRASGAPSNNPVPASFQALVQNDGSVSYLTSFNYTPATSSGGRLADGFAVFVDNVDSTPTLTSGHFIIRARDTTAGTFTTYFQLDGCSQDKITSFAVAAYRKSERGYEMGSIIGSTTAPDWQGVTQGTPNYLGNISGRRQHSWTLQAAGLGASDLTVLIQKDTTEIYKTTGASALDAARSYQLTVYNLNSETVTFGPQSYDVYNWQAEAENLRRRLLATTGVANMCIVLGLSRPQRNRLSNLPRMTMVTSNNTPRIWGVEQTVTGFTVGVDYDFKVWMSLVSIGTSGSLRASLNGVVAFGDTTAVNAPAGSYTQYTHTRNATATSYTLRLSSNNASSLTGFFMEAWIRSANAAVNPGTNMVVDGDFSGGGTAWTQVNGGPSASDTLAFTASTNYRGLSTALVEKGASRQLFENDAFQENSAYILVGTHNVGEGNGLQVYAGTTALSTVSSAKLTLKTEDAEIVGLTGQGWQPTFSPGLPTNNPTPSAITTTSRDTGEQIYEFTWTYTQPALESTNRLADGFIFYVASGDVADPSSSPIGAFLIDVDKRSFPVTAPYGQTWTGGIASFRRTASGIERGPVQVSSSAPDWRGLTGSQQIITNGILTSAITTALLSSECVTTIKMVADAVTTGKRQDVNSQSHSTSVPSWSSGLPGYVSHTFTHAIGKVPVVTVYADSAPGIVGVVQFVGTTNIDVAAYNFATSGTYPFTFVVKYW